MCDALAGTGSSGVTREGTPLAWPGAAGTERALAWFVTFSAQAAALDSVQALVQLSIEAAAQALPQVTVVYAEFEGEQTALRWWSAVMTAGEVARVARVTPTALQGGVPGEAQFPRVNRGSVAVVPCGSRAALVVLTDRADWTALERTVVAGVGGTLARELTRAAARQAQDEQREELLARTQALEAFAELTRDLTREREPLKLVGRAQDLLVSLLPRGVTTYYELTDDTWHLQSHRGVFQNAALLASLRRGVRRGSVANIDRPFDTRAAFYQDMFDPATAADRREVFGEIRATAAFPVMVGEAVQGVLVFGRQSVAPWTGVERAVLETVVSSLGLALEGVRGAAHLARVNADLRAMNEELAAFSYSVSHDLMTPVRHVLSFAQLARADVDDRGKVLRYLEIVEQGARRMDALISAMLQLSRTGRQELRPGWVNLHDLVRQAQPATPDRDVRWVVRDLPVVWGDREALLQVFRCLLDNAVKFSRPRAEALIEVWAEDSPEGWAVSVRDNGVGFDPRYAGKLFGIFQRLHRQEEFAGEGVGLANVRRIVARHHGAVRAEGRPEGGATFTFTLPRPVTDDELR